MSKLFKPGTIQEIIDQHPDHSFLSADGLEEAVIGVTFNLRRLVYSVPKCTQILMGMGMTREDAEEYFDFNVRDAYVGPQTPIWIET